MPIMAFGLMTIVFCVLYSVVSCILVYRLAPKRLSCGCKTGGFQSCQLAWLRSAQLLEWRLDFAFEW